MTVKIRISDDDGELLDWWLNFDSSDAVYASAASVMRDIERRLVESGGTLCEGFWAMGLTDKPWVEFDSEEMATLFLLRWS